MSLMPTKNPLFEGPGFFDPNAPFVEQAEQLKRKQALADQITAQAMAQLGQTPEGKMVGGQWIRPDVGSTIQNAFGMYAGSGMNREAAQQSSGLRKAIDEAAQKHIEAMPVPRSVAHEAPFMEGEEAAPAGNFNVQTVTPADRVKWAQAGMHIPTLRGTLEKVVQDQLIEEPVRAENRAFRAAESEAGRTERAERAAADRTLREELAKATLEQRQREAQQRSEDLKLSLEQRREAAREANELRRELAQLNADLRRDIARSQGGGGAGTGRILPTKSVTELGEARANAEALDGLSKTFKPEFGGARGAITSVTGRYADNLGGPSGEWWTNYRRQAELVERHSLFGASLTGGEQDAWRKANITPGMDPEQIRRNLETRAKLAKKVFENKVEDLGESGYNVGAFKNRGGATGEWGAGGTGGGGATPPPPKSSPAAGETKSIGGKTYVKRDGKWFEQ